MNLFFIALLWLLSVKCGLLDNSAKRDIQGPKNRRLPKPKHTKQILSQRQEGQVVSPDAGHSPSTIPINMEPFTWNELLMNFKLDPSKYPTVSSAKDNKDLIEYINLNLPSLSNDVLLAMDYDCVGVIDWRKADDAFMKRLSEVHASTSKEKNPITALLEVKKNDELNHGDKVSCSFLFFLMLPYFLI